MGYLSSVFFKTGTAGFGIAVGLDYMVNRDRKTWIYKNKPYLGFIVGIALN